MLTTGSPPQRKGRKRFLPGIVALVLMAMVGLSYQQFRQFNRTNAYTAQSQAIVSSIDRLLESLTEAETGQRGFLLTGEVRYLEPYNRAIQQIPAELSAASRLLAERSDQSAVVARLNALTADKLAELAETIDLRRTRGLAPALNVVLSDRGKQVMEQIRAICDQIRRAEASSQSQASTEGETAAGTALLVTILGSMVLLFLFAFGLDPFASPEPAAWRRSWLLRYGAAVLAVVAVALLRGALTPLIGRTNLPFALFFYAVAFAAWFGGFRPAVLSVVLSLLIGAWLFAAPTRSLYVSGRDDQVAMFAIVVVGFGAALLTRSQRTAVEQADRERQRFETTLTSIGDAVIATDPQGKITFANRTALALLRAPESGVAGKAIDDVFRIIDEDSRAIVESPVAKVLREGAVVSLANHTVLIAQDGTEVPIDDSAAPIRIADGSVQGAVLVFRDIAARRQAEATNQLLASIIESSDDAIISKDLNGVITSWNRGAEQIFGYSAEEAIGKPVSMLAPPDRKHEMRDILERLRSGERIAHFETVRRTKRGELLNISLTVSPVHDADGRIVGASKIARDITRQKQAERQLALVNDELAEELRGTRGLHELGQRLIALKDWRSLLSEILTAARTITGADMSNIQLLDHSGALRIESQHGFEREFLDFFDTVRDEEASACGAALARRERIVVEDVEKSPIFAGTPALKVMLNAGVKAVQSTPLTTHAGVLVGILSTHYREARQPGERDLRLIDLLARQAAELIARIRVEAELRSTQQQLASITDNMSAAVARCSRDLRYLWVSPAYAAWLGIPSDQIAGKYIRDVIGAEGYVRIRPYVERVLSGQKVDYTAEVKFRNIGKRWIHAVYVPMTSEDHEIEGWTAVVSDVTEQKLSEARLVKANTELARANNDLNQFAFAASHDLQEPLRMISAYSQLLVKSYRGQLDAEAANWVGFITDGTERMRDLLADLLAYTQLGNGEEAEALTAINLNQVFSKAVENCKASIVETKAVVTSDDLPTVYGREAHFIQLFQNLISNALKYRSELPPRVHLSTQKQDGLWRIAVADNGIGIAPEYHERVFGVFKRLHGKTIAGTGMGLAICQRVVQRYGGRIWVESKVDEGATFYFTVPAAESAAVCDA